MEGDGVAVRARAERASGVRAHRGSTLPALVLAAVMTLDALNLLPMRSRGDRLRSGRRLRDCQRGTRRRRGAVRTRRRSAG